ncbi:unnamed protein product [Phytophthora lilii]|uniref:Unnamed protein product n=1 Tax=Phytophthora lilii TaxID=2077276 RepID=A0A9W6X602_9STRA|nr:unnamed protein product [Phytophthora lilii]
MGGISAETVADLERQSCMYHDQSLGGVKDFSDEFKAAWGVKEARCKTIVDAVKYGAQPIVYTQWRENIEAHFGCPVPSKAATPAPSTQIDQTQQQEQVVNGNIGEEIAGAIAQFTQSV